MIVSDDDFSAHEVHAHFADARQRLERALNGFDFIGAIHPGDAKGGLRTGPDFGIQNRLARRPGSVAAIVVVAAATVVSMFVFVTHGF